MRPEKLRILTLEDLFKGDKTSAVGLTAEQARDLLTQMTTASWAERQFKAKQRVIGPRESATRAHMKAARAERLASNRQVPPPTAEQLGAVLTVSRPRMT